MWENITYFIDGATINDNLYVVRNPSNFGATGTAVGQLASSSGSFISRFDIPTASGFEWALYPGAVGGSKSTYVTDGFYASGINPVMLAGAHGGLTDVAGLFFTANNTTSGTSDNRGCRLMKLPNN